MNIPDVVYVSWECPTCKAKYSVECIKYPNIYFGRGGCNSKESGGGECDTHINFTVQLDTDIKL